jgi:hypothetical protein
MLASVFNWVKNKAGYTSISTEQAVEQLNENLRELIRHESKINNDIKECHRNAKLMVERNDLANATLLLQKIKILEASLQNIYKQKFNIETQISSIQKNELNQKLVKNMKVSHDIFKQTMSKTDTKYTRELVEDMANDISQMNEFDNILGISITNQTDVSSDLNNLINIVADEEKLKFDSSVPSPPINNKNIYQIPETSAIRHRTNNYSTAPLENIPIPSSDRESYSHIYKPSNDKNKIKVIM